MTSLFAEFQARYQIWLSAQPHFVKKIAGGSVGVALWVVIIVVFAAMVISTKMTAQEQLIAPLGVRILLGIVDAAFLLLLAIFTVAIARSAVQHFVGDGNEGAGWRRFAISAVILWLGLRAFHYVVFEAWTFTPFAAEEQRVAARYSDLCTVPVQDDANSGHIEEDWHSGVYICAPLKRELHGLYPSPAWIFGSPPSDE